MPEYLGMGLDSSMVVESAWRSTTKASGAERVWLVLADGRCLWHRCWSHAPTTPIRATACKGLINYLAHEWRRDSATEIVALCMKSGGFLRFHTRLREEPFHEDSMHDWEVMVQL